MYQQSRTHPLRHPYISPNISLLVFIGAETVCDTPTSHKPQETTTTPESPTWFHVGSHTTRRYLSHFARLMRNRNRIVFEAQPLHHKSRIDRRISLFASPLTSPGASCVLKPSSAFRRGASSARRRCGAADKFWPHPPVGRGGNYPSVLGLHGENLPRCDAELEFALVCFVDANQNLILLFSSTRCARRRWGSQLARHMTCLQSR